MVDHVFPQTDDPDDAQNFGQWLGRANISDYVEAGMGFTVDYTVPEVTVAAGKAYVSETSATATTTAESRSYGVDYVVEIDAKTVALNATTLNYVWLDANAGTDDSPSLTVTTSSTSPNDESLLLGRVDTSANTKSELNRDPTATFDNINRGNDTQSGDGTSTTFTIAHGLDGTPKYVDVKPGTEDASTDFWLDAGGTNITINYAAAPPSGTNNLSWYWEAEL